MQELILFNPPSRARQLFSIEFLSALSPARNSSSSLHTLQLSSIPHICPCPSISHDHLLPLDTELCVVVNTTPCSFPFISSILTLSAVYIFYMHVSDSSACLWFDYLVGVLEVSVEAFPFQLWCCRGCQNRHLNDAPADGVSGGCRDNQRPKRCYGIHMNAMQVRCLYNVCMCFQSR